MGKLHQVRCDGGGILPQGAHGTNPWHVRPPDKEGQQGKDRDDNLCDVLTQAYVDSEVSSEGVSRGISYCGTTLGALHVPPISVQGGSGSRGGGAAAPL